MSGRIRQDEQEFLDIVRGKLRKDLGRFLRQGSVVLPTSGSKGGRLIRIPFPRIEIPQLRFGPPPENVEEPTESEDGMPSPGDIGVGTGPGKPGDILGPVKRGQGDGEDGDGEGDGEKGAGQGHGETIIDVEISEEEFAEIFGEYLELPRIKPKGSKSINTESRKYTDIRPVGPQALLHKRRTFKNALRRQLAEGVYDPSMPRVVPIREDRRYRAPEIITKPQNNAVLVWKFDVSGSMGPEERRMVRFLCALCEFWLASNYDNLDTVYIIHDGEAERVSREAFFTTTRGGGTTSSTAHELMLKIIEDEYPPAEWNIYSIYLSDGFNYGSDNDYCMELIDERIIPIVNLYGYVEVAPSHGWFSGGGPFSSPGNFGAILEKTFGDDHELVVNTTMHSMDEVPDAIRALFGKGN